MRKTLEEVIAAILARRTEDPSQAVFRIDMRSKPEIPELNDAASIRRYVRSLEEGLVGSTVCYDHATAQIVVTFLRHDVEHRDIEEYLL